MAESGDSPIAHRFGDSAIVRDLRRAFVERDLGDFLFSGYQFGNVWRCPFISTLELAAMGRAVRQAYLPPGGTRDGGRPYPQYLPREIVESGTLLDLSWPSLSEAEREIALGHGLSRLDWEFNASNPHYRTFALGATDFCETGLALRESRKSMAACTPRSGQFRLPKNRDLDGAAGVMAFDRAVGALIAQLRDLRYRYLPGPILAPARMNRPYEHCRWSWTQVVGKEGESESRRADDPDTEDLSGLMDFGEGVFREYAVAGGDGLSARREALLWVANPSAVRADVYVRICMEDEDADFWPGGAEPAEWFLTWTKVGRVDPHSLFRLPLPDSPPALPRGAERPGGERATASLQICYDYGPYWEYFPAR